MVDNVLKIVQVVNMVTAQQVNACHAKMVVLSALDLLHVHHAKVDLLSLVEFVNHAPKIVTIVQVVLHVQLVLHPISSAMEHVRLPVL